MDLVANPEKTKVVVTMVSDISAFIMRVHYTKLINRTTSTRKAILKYYSVSYCDENKHLSRIAESASANRVNRMHFPTDGAEVRFENHHRAGGFRCGLYGWVDFD